jgi:hypothetical protein
MIDLVFSIVLKLIQVWRFHFVGLGMMLKYKISLIWYSPVVLLKIKFLGIKNPHPPILGSGVESRFGSPSALKYR